MYSSKLLKILATFTNREIIKCELFVESPFFNKRKELVTFYKYVTNYHPDYEHHTLKAEQAFQYMYPEDVFSEPKLRHLMSGLTKLLEQFLIQLALQKSESDQQRKLLKSYAERNLLKIFDTTFKKHVRKVDTQPIRNIEYYHHQYLIKKQKAEVHNEKIDNILETANDLDIFYITAKLHNACLIEAFKERIQVDFEVEDLFLMPQIFKHIETHPEQQKAPAIFVYYLIYKMLSAPDKMQDQYFEDLLGQLKNQKIHFIESEIDSMYLYAQNYCIKRINQNQQSYRLKLFELYEMRLQNNFIILPEWEYLNIVRLSIDLKEFQFTAKFIKDYENKIKIDSKKEKKKEEEEQDEKEKKNAPNLAKALYEFSQKNWDKTLSHLQRVHISDSLYYLHTNTVMIKVYYEKKQKAPLGFLIKAFNMYLQRSHKSQLSLAYIKRYKRLAKYLRRLNRIQELIGKREKKKAALALQKIIDEINKDKTVADIDWLREKINELLLKLGMKVIE